MQRIKTPIGKDDKISDVILMENGVQEMKFPGGYPLTADIQYGHFIYQQRFREVFHVTSWTPQGALDVAS